VKEVRVRKVKGGNVATPSHGGIRNPKNKTGGTTGGSPGEGHMERKKNTWLGGHARGPDLKAGRESHRKKMSGE